MSHLFSNLFEFGYPFLIDTKLKILMFMLGKPTVTKKKRPWTSR